MADFDVNGLDELMKDLTSLEIDRIAPKMLEESAPILKKNVKRNAQRHIKTGEMQQSIKTSKANRTGTGYSITVRPTGKDKKGVRNMDKMADLEFGTTKQAASPVIAPSVRECELSVAEKMQEVFDREVEHDNL